MNTSVKVVLYTSKKLSNGEYPVMLRIIKNRRPKYISTGVSCTRELWDEKQNILRKKHPHYKAAKLLISKKKLEAEKFVYDLENNNRNLSAHEIKSKLKKKTVNNPYALVYFDKVIDRFKASGQIKNAEVYKDTKRNLSHFTNDKDIHFSDVDVLFLNKFEEYLRANGKGPNTIYVYLRTLRALINKAIKEDVTSDQYYPFRNFSLSKYAKIKTEKRAISRDDIEKIKTVNLSSEPALILAQKIFLFSFYCRGMNFIDIAYLKWKDIQSDRLTYTRQKTKELFNLELMEPAKQILKYFRPQTYDGKDSYVFPIFNEAHVSPQTRHNRKTKMLRQINQDLKKIGEKAKIEGELTTYVARHSYATILKRSGISTTIISQALGHDSEKTTQVYLESFENSVLDEASKALL
jgi:integrase